MESITLYVLLATLAVVTFLLVRRYQAVSSLRDQLYTQISQLDMHLTQIHQDYDDTRRSLQIYTLNEPDPYKEAANSALSFLNDVESTFSYLADQYSATKRFLDTRQSIIGWIHLFSLKVHQALDTSLNRALSEAQALQAKMLVRNDYVVAYQQVPFSVMQQVDRLKQRIKSARVLDAGLQKRWITTEKLVMARKEIETLVFELNTLPILGEQTLENMLFTLDEFPKVIIDGWQQFKSIEQRFLSCYRYINQCNSRLQELDRLYVSLPSNMNRTDLIMSRLANESRHPILWKDSLVEIKRLQGSYERIQVTGTEAVPIDLDFHVTKMQQLEKEIDVIAQHISDTDQLRRSFITHLDSYGSRVAAARLIGDRAQRLEERAARYAAWISKEDLDELMSTAALVADLYRSSVPSDASVSLDETKLGQIVDQLRQLVECVDQVKGAFEDLERKIDKLQIEDAERVSQIQTLVRTSDGILRSVEDVLRQYEKLPKYALRWSASQNRLQAYQVEWNKIAVLEHGANPERIIEQLKEAEQLVELSDRLRLSVEKTIEYHEDFITLFVQNQHLFTGSSSWTVRAWQLQQKALHYNAELFPDPERLHHLAEEAEHLLKRQTMIVELAADAITEEATPDHLHEAQDIVALRTALSKYMQQVDEILTKIREQERRDQEYVRISLDRIDQAIDVIRKQMRELEGRSECAITWTETIERVNDMHRRRHQAGSTMPDREPALLAARISLVNGLQREIDETTAHIQLIGQYQLQLITLLEHEQSSLVEMHNLKMSVLETYEQVEPYDPRNWNEDWQFVSELKGAYEQYFDRWQRSIRRDRSVAIGEAQIIHDLSQLHDLVHDRAQFMSKLKRVQGNLTVIRSREKYVRNQIDVVRQRIHKLDLHRATHLSSKQPTHFRAIYDRILELPRECEEVLASLELRREGKVEKKASQADAIAQAYQTHLFELGRQLHDEQTRMTDKIASDHKLILDTSLIGRESSYSAEIREELDYMRSVLSKIASKGHNLYDEDDIHRLLSLSSRLASAHEQTHSLLRTLLNLAKLLRENDDRAKELVERIKGNIWPPVDVDLTRIQRYRDGGVDDLKLLRNKATIKGSIDAAIDLQRTYEDIRSRIDDAENSIRNQAQELIARERRILERLSQLDDQLRNTSEGSASAELAKRISEVRQRLAEARRPRAYTPHRHQLVSDCIAEAWRIASDIAGSTVIYGDSVSGDKINVGSIIDSNGVAIGRNASSNVEGRK